MEVHAHPHSPRKKWTHYFWEFFMLFLAVTLGFFVENQREHYVEHQREKKYIQSLFYDIKADTARVNQIIAARNSREISLDSISLLLNSNTVTEHSGDLYFHAVTAARTIAFRFIPNDGTLQQLKNSGAFRLIRDRTVADSIAKYDVSVRSVLRQGELEETLIQDYRSVAPKVFNALVFDQMLDEDNNPRRLSNTKTALLSFGEDDLHVFNYKLYSMKALNKAIRRDIKLLLKQAEQLLSLLSKKYGIK